MHPCYLRGKEKKNREKRWKRVLLIASKRRKAPLKMPFVA
jgi:hypothetical protein